MKTFYDQCKELEDKAEGILSLAALHLPSGTRLNYQSDYSHLLLSIYKIPIAICLLQYIEISQLSFQVQISVMKSDLVQGSYTYLNKRLEYNYKVKISLFDLLVLMLQDSCNTATDVILKLIGGPVAVNSMLAFHKIKNISVDRYVAEALSEFEQKKSMRLKNINIKKIYPSWGNKDCGTPNGIIELLKNLLDEKIIHKEHTVLLLNIMQKCKTGKNRIISGLPKDLVVSRKTGTLAGFVHEAAIIFLPKNISHLVLTIFISGSEKSVAFCEHIMSVLAKYTYDYFMCLENINKA
jgi:beta-lactamase class A